MASVKKSLLLSFAQRNGSLVIQFLSSLLIARLLSPHEIGIFSIGSVIVSFSHIVRDFGVANYVVQERELSPDRIRSAQAIVWITSVLIAAALLLGAGVAGELYSEPGVTLTMRVLAVNFLLLPLGSITMALMVREMQFARMFAINMTSCVVQNGTAILLAWLGAGFISLAWGTVAAGVVSAVGLLFCRQVNQPWLPGLKEWRRVFSAGTKLSGSSFFYELGQGGPELVCGKMLGFETVAYFSRGVGAASMLLRALVDGVVPVANSYFAKKSREDEGIKSHYLTAISYLGAFALPAFACLAVMAEPLILFLYGEQWLEAARPMQIVSLGLAGIAIANIAGAVLVGSGRIGVNLKMHAMFQPLKVVMVFFASFAGLNALVMAVAFGDVIITWYSISRANRLVGASWSEFAASLLPTLGLALGTALVCAGALALGQGSGVALKVAIGSIAAGAGWLALLLAMRHPLVHEMRAKRA